MLVYVDTDIILNYLLDRKNRQGDSLGLEAEMFFIKIFLEDMQMIISTKTLEELYEELHDPGRAEMLFLMLKAKNKLTIVIYTDQDLLNAEKLDPLNRNDALHAILAKSHGARYLVTRNMIHFKKFSSLIQPKFPYEV